MAYSATILEHFRHPRNQRALARATAWHEAYNALCGDRVRIELEIAGGTIVDAAFTASACAVCTAAASLLTDRLRGLGADAALPVDENALLAALDPDLPAARRACAALPLTAARMALEQQRP